MPIDLRTINGDIAFPLRRVTGDNLVVQRIERRLRTHLGEWFLDQSKGLDFLGWISQRPPPLATISGRTRVAVETCPGVLRVVSWDATHDAASRTVEVTGHVLLSSGAELGLTVATGVGNAANTAPWLFTIQRFT